MGSIFSGPNQSSPPAPVRATLALRQSAPYASFSPAGDAFATGGTDGIVHIWKRDRPSWTHSLPLTGHDGYVNGVAFSPDGRTLVSAGDDGTIALWDVAHEGPLGDRLAAPDGVIEGLAVSSRGAIATSHYTGIIRTWSSLLLERDPHVWQRIICGVVGRGLTPAEWHAAAASVPYMETCGA